MCGIVGISGANNASEEVRGALLMLQHRGQDSAGILSVDSEQGKFHLHKALGFVSEVFTERDMKRLQGGSAIGHTRYSTIGEVREADLQPMALSHPTGLALVHNGNISNFDEVKSRLKGQDRMFMSDNDLELILHLMSQVKVETLFETVKSVSAEAKGGYSVIGLLGDHGIFAFRDPHGIRPLVMGVREEGDGKKAYCFTSETCALQFLGFQYVKDLKAGEVVFVSKSGELKSRLVTEKKALPCMFEWVYFSSADSTLEAKNVYEVRLRLGQRLAARIDRKFDVVAPVPDTSRPSAIALAESLGIPFREVLLKNRYVQRSFITSGQDKRKLAVGLKFSVIDELVKGKSVLLVDDSIVRGTTSKKIIELLRYHGAKEVFLASTCPPIQHPCFYGIAFPSHKELIAHNQSEQGVAELLGADGVYYTNLEDLEYALKTQNFCRACLTGDYVYS